MRADRSGGQGRSSKERERGKKRKGEGGGRGVEEWKRKCCFQDTSEQGRKMSFLKH